jgi:hypothetical protein
MQLDQRQASVKPASARFKSLFEDCLLFNLILTLDRSGILSGMCQARQSGFQRCLKGRDADSSMIHFSGSPVSVNRKQRPSIDPDQQELPISLNQERCPGCAIRSLTVVQEDPPANAAYRTVAIDREGLAIGDVGRIRRQHHQTINAQPL